MKPPSERGGPLLQLDGITAGNVVGFLMECTEKGLLQESDIGFPMAFGNDESIINAIHLIGKTGQIHLIVLHHRRPQALKKRNHRERHAG